MDIQHVPPALHEHLGPDATLGLVSAINAAGREWKDGVMNAAGDRFERRLVEEVSKLRVEMGAMEGRLTHRMFLFWIGQVLSMTAIMSVLLRPS